MSITAIETAIANDLADGNSRTAAGKITQLIRAVIADEAAKAADAKQPEPQGDVPEWWREGWACGADYMPMWKKAESELTRRVAEATADKDRRIAELEKERDNYKRLFDDAIDAVDEVFQTRSDRDPPILPNFCPLGASKFRAVVKLAKEYKSLKQQLSTATAEVERLKRDAEQGQAVAEVANMHGWNGCEHSKVLSVHIAEELTELAKLREEVARLSRPVEGVKELRELALCEWETTSACLETILDERILPRLCVERNAREAAEQRATDAESERDELREFVNHCHVWCGGTWQERHSPLNDGDLDAAMKAHAAYRAEKGKVQACPTGG